MARPAVHNPAPPRPGNLILLPLPPAVTRARAREHRAPRSSPLTVAVGLALAFALGWMFLYSAFLTPAGWNASDPDYRAGVSDAG